MVCAVNGEIDLHIIFVLIYNLCRLPAETLNHFRKYDDSVFFQSIRITYHFQSRIDDKDSPIIHIRDL